MNGWVTSMDSEKVAIIGSGGSHSLVELVHELEAKGLAVKVVDDNPNTSVIPVRRCELPPALPYVRRKRGSNLTPRKKKRRRGGR